MEAADAHLAQADPVMAGLIADGGPLPLEPDYSGRPSDAYASLLRGIAGQQLSVRAAQSIYARLLERFGGRPPTPEEILADEPDALKAAAGLSRAKVASLRSLAEHLLTGELQLDALEQLSDSEATRQLVAVKGIGQWTADMFLMFTLRREDVLPVGDLGIRNAARRAYGLEAMPTPDEVVALAEPWRPYRTRASLYLWRSLRNTPDV